MLDRFAVDIIAGINESLTGKTATPDVIGGHAAAVSVIELMRGTVKLLPPLTVIDAYNDAEGRERIPRMFELVGKKTIACMAEGCLRLASLWASAWKEGGGNAIPTTQLVEVKRGKLKTLYNNPDFLPAIRLQDPAFPGELT